MRKLFICTALMLASLASAESRQNETYLRYIADWQETALQQQKDYGIPAAITLAQGLLESAAGTSELAQKANNHFGIKCTSDWMGPTYAYDDDARGECFRMYGDAAMSFIDHSLFLQRPRYRVLYTLPATDYEAWARQLKQCGYATDPGYAQKLIRIIEDYRLDTIGRPADTEPVEAEVVEPAPAEEPAVEPTPAAEPVVEPAPAEEPAVEPTPAAEPVVETSAAEPAPAPAPVAGEGPQKPVVVQERPVIAVITHDPEPEYKEPLTAYEERREFMALHPMNRTNGCRYVVAQEGDTYANVAFRLNVKERTLRCKNDALGRTLQPGDRVYLDWKRRYAPREKALMWVFKGEKLWDVCQREGVRIASIRRLNEFDKGLVTLETTQKILMRKPRKEYGK